jgi:hypothetical protein
MDIYAKDGLRPWLMCEMGGKGRKIWLLVDENLSVLVPAFKDAGFRVLTPPQGMLDDDVKEMAEGTLIITKNSKDFIDDAVSFDYDVVGVEGIKFIDTEKSKKNQTTRKIVSAIAKSRIWNLIGYYFLEVKDNGTFNLKKLD